MASGIVPGLSGRDAFFAKGGSQSFQCYEIGSDVGRGGLQKQGHLMGGLSFRGSTEQKASHKQIILASENIPIYCGEAVTEFCMPRTEKSTAVLSRPSRRLLKTLALPNASAKENQARPDFLAVAAPKGRITSVVASLPLSAAEPLVAQALAVWHGAMLTITDEGRAHLRRLSAPREDAFATQHREIAREIRDPGEKPVTVDANESPLAWLARRCDRDGKPFLAPDAIEAGERFRRDVTVGQLLPRVTSNWSAHGAGRSDPSIGLLPGEAALAARQRVDRALHAVGDDLAGLLLDACGFLKRLETIESERGWPPRSGKIVLRLALTQLARHYGLAGYAQGPAGSRGLQHWGTPDYRPKISASG